jgi:hypothetical protein
MQAPEQADFMTEVMIDKMSKLPNDVTVNEPVPGESSVDDRVLFEQTDTEYDSSDRNEFAHEGIQHVREKRNFVFYRFEFSEDECLYYFDEKQYRKKRTENGEDTIVSKQLTVISGMNYFEQFMKTKKIFQPLYY